VELTPEQEKNIRAHIKAIQKRLDDGTQEQGDDFALGELQELLPPEVLECCGEDMGYCTCPL